MTITTKTTPRRAPAPVAESLSNQHKDPCTPGVRAGIYCRISRDKTGQMAGIQRQEPDCRDLCASLGWDVAEVYVDNDISAYSGKKRPAYERMKADLEAGRIDAVVAWHPDRLYRRARELELVIDLVQKAKAQVATVQAGAVDLATPNGRLVARIGASVAQHESEHKAERVKRWHRQRAEAGKPNGGIRPFGFTPDRVTHDPVEAELIREAAARVLAGERRLSIVLDWNTRGVATVTGRPWSTITLGDILRAPRTAGYREHGDKLHEAQWEPILDRETWEAVKAAMKVERAPAGRPVVYPLSGILMCGICGQRLTGSRTNARSGRTRLYRCGAHKSVVGGCGKIARNAAYVEEFVRESVIAALVGPEFTAALAEAAPPDDEAHRDAIAALAALEARLERLKAEYAVEGLWSKADFVRQKQELEGRIAAAGDELGRFTGSRRRERLPDTVEGMRDWWAQATPAQIREVVGLVVDKVLVHSTTKGGKGFDPNAVEIVFKPTIKMVWS